ncbi:MAG: hypothetical protein MOB07_16940 [Acidobacteria bacterium]|nr:hypothetical protein [Acidobacteriota bacterium]
MPDADDEADQVNNGDLHAASAQPGQGANSHRGILDVEREEMMVAIRKVFTANGALNTNDALRTVARTLGFARAGARIEEAIRNNLAVAVRRRILVNEGGAYALCCRKIGEYRRDEMIDALLGAMGRGWTERDEAIRAAARWLGFHRTGRAISEAFKSVINGAIRRGWLEYQGSQIRKAG